MFLNQFTFFSAVFLLASVESKRDCFCLPYWQCNGVIEDEISDIVDVRSFGGSSNKTNNTELCAGDLDVWCCPIQCGRSQATGSTRSRRILHGDQASFAEFPWMLGILSGKKYRCGASLIHPQVALTAAHCIQPDGVYTLRAGEWDWLETNEPFPHQDRSIEKKIIHPQFHGGTLRNDIGLLILSAPFQLTDNVGIICLPPQQTTEEAVIRKCIASGWGKNSYEKGTYQSTLKKVTLPTVARNKCQKSLQTARLGPFFQLHKSFICAGADEYKDTCKGDGGSPLICPVNKAEERYEQIGIVSWGLTCGLQNTPGVYVNVALYRTWIDEILSENNFLTYY